MKRLALFVAVAGLWAAAPPEAAAQGSAATTLTPPTDPHGVAVLIGGGLTSYIQPQMRAFAGAGGYWELRSVIGTRHTLGLEVAYVGSTHGFTRGAATLLTNAAEGSLRLNVPTVIAARRLLLEPFSFVGLGWTRLTVLGEVHDGMVPNHFRVATVPVGVGFALGHEGFFADARLVYRPILGGDSLPRLEAGAVGVQSWSLGALAGWEF
jgi:hypothetical protein